MNGETKTPHNPFFLTQIFQRRWYSQPRVFRLINNVFKVKTHGGRIPAQVGAKTEASRNRISATASTSTSTPSNSSPRSNRSPFSPFSKKFFEFRRVYIALPSPPLPPQPWPSLLHAPDSTCAHTKRQVNSVNLLPHLHLPTPVLERSLSRSRSETHKKPTPDPWSSLVEGGSALPYSVPVYQKARSVYCTGRRYLMPQNDLAFCWTEKSSPHLISQ